MRGTIVSTEGLGPTPTPGLSSHSSSTLDPAAPPSSSVVVWLDAEDWDAVMGKCAGGRVRIVADLLALAITTGRRGFGRP